MIAVITVFQVAPGKLSKARDYVSMHPIMILIRFTYILLTVGLSILLIYCEPEKDEYDKTPPVLSVTPVDISTVTFIIAFGDDLTPIQKNPAFEYIVNDSDVQVRASCGGIVDTVFLNDNFPDYEVWIKTSSNSVYYIEYDHVLNLTVVEGEEVTAGAVLGTVGVGDRTELMVCVYDPDSLAYCPFDFATEEFIQQHKSFTEKWCLEDAVVP